MGLPDFTPRLIELQAQNTKLAHDKALLIKAVEDLLKLCGSFSQDTPAISNAVATLKKVEK